jgi:alpha/beta superfamily hydrolase
MNSATEKFQVTGPVGVLECARDLPAGVPRGVALIAHPHPLFGGTMDNKVVQTLARACVQCGWTAVRFNFRGVGASAGSYGEGLGEIDDMQAVLEQVAPSGELVLAGFSFGSAVASQVYAREHSKRSVSKLVLVGTAASRFKVAAIDAAEHDKVLVVHGEADDTVPLAAVMDWARPMSLPVTVVPGGGHFFHGQLPLLKNLVARHLRS